MNLDRLIDRRGTASLKWDHRKPLAGKEELLPLWVADMDFPAPRQVLAALRRRVRHGVFGYTLEPESWFEAASAWVLSRHAWTSSATGCWPVPEWSPPSPWPSWPSPPRATAW